VVRIQIILLLLVSGTAIAQDAGPADVAPAVDDDAPAVDDDAPAVDGSTGDARTVDPKAATVTVDDAPQVSKLRSTTAAEAAGAPAAADAANHDVAPDGSSAALWVPRVVFFPVRAAFYAVNYPIRKAIWYNEKFDVVDRVQGVFFDDERIYGLYPTALFETGFGLNVGARFVHKDILKTGVALKLRAGFGGQFKHANFSNALPVSWDAKITTTYERRPKDRFSGFGNNELSEGVIVPDMDPSAVSVDTRYRQDVLSTWLVAGYRPKSRVSLTTIVGHSWRTFSEAGGFGDEASLSRVYDTALVPGFEDGFQQLTSGVDLAYDSRRGFTEWDPDTIPSFGVLLSTFASANLGIGKSDHAFTRIGGDAQGFIRVGQGPRVLAARFTTESTVALRGSVPFVEVPRLGGRLLRGYGQDQFRDSITALGTIEYSFDAGRSLRGALFTDAGRTFPDSESLSLEDLRVGYGGEIRFVGGEQVVGRITISSSIDGGLFTLLSFDSAFGSDKRHARN
jgi:hypothetical protein